MKYRLQGYVAAFGAHTINAFDLAAWRQATTLSYFGVGLRVRAGALRVALTHIAPDGSRNRLALLECPDPGEAFSPPLHLPDLDGVLLPEIEAHSEGVDYDLYFGTDDAPATPWLRVGYLCATDRAEPAMACAESFDNYLRIYGDGEIARLVLLGAGGSPLPAGTEQISALDTDRPARPEQALYEACYGRLAPCDFTHLCLIGADQRPDPEQFARTTALLRFLRPGWEIAAPLYTPQPDAPDRPGDRLHHGWQARATLDPGDREILREILLPPPPPEADIPNPGWRALTHGDLLRAGPPAPLLASQSAAEHALRLRAAGVGLLQPLSLWTLPDPIVGSDGLPPAPPPRQALRDRMLRLMLAGQAPGPQVAALIRTALEAGDLPRARDALGALDDLLSGVQSPGPAAPPLPTGPVDTRAGIEIRLTRALERLEQQGPHLLAHYRDRRDRAPLPAPISDAATATTGGAELQVLRQGLATLRQELATAYLRIETLHDALQRARQSDSDRIAALLRHNRLEHTPQVLGDLDRASLAALHLLRNRHAGRRAVILGNGPSLRISDLDRLTGEITFASNKIYLGFGETLWRPTYYSVEDSLVMQHNRDRIAALRGVTKIFPDNMRQFGYQEADAIFIPFLPPASFEAPLSDPDFPDFSEDLCRGICWGSSIIYSQIQMALHMGCREIVLTGVDHDYQLPDRRQGRFYVHENEQNHFHPDYRSPGETWHQPNLEVIEVSFARARAACAARGVPVINASRQSRLDIFDRADFDRLFPPRRRIRP
ncbi:hypothetical protein [Pseudodonghicola xiamenensis]|uniref:DUF115 domain-containing protein n=1 Tax=Pseudodonghicola xiamenensis TaxID=337702 RepID=A0A8J3HB61_9RHOB|nr:hypothetical protein [Pseudodonghicola xiamenensis]GHG97645.1 hypothetical protein GCM10010961_32510 [Pseudodonghicola xiamenensis]